MNHSAILLTLSVCVGVTMTGLGIIWPLVPVYAVELGATGVMVGLVIAGYNISRVTFSPFVGPMSDRLGRKNFIVTGLMAYAVISFFYVMANYPQTLVLIRFCHGLASLFVFPIAMALAADIAPRHKLGLYLGTLNMAAMIGLGAGPALGGIIRDAFGINTAFYAMGILTLLTLLLAVVFIPADRTALDKKFRKAPSSLKTILSHRIVLGILVMRFFTACGQGTVYSFLPILALEIGLPSSQVGIILSANIFFIAFFQRSSGKLADRINPKNMVICGTFATGLTVLGMPFATGFVTTLLLNIAMGVANGFSLPSGLVIIGQYGQRLGMASLMSMTDAAWSLGMIVSPIVSGIILDTAGPSNVFIIGSMMITAGGISVSCFLKNYHPEKTRGQPIKSGTATR